MPRLLLRILLSLSLSVATYAAVPITPGQMDGPYVMRGADGRVEAWRVVASAKGPVKASHPVPRSGVVTVDPVAKLPGFEVKVRGPEPDAPDSVTLDPAAPLYIVADTHGEYEILATQLVKHGVLDAKLRWKYGHGHLVFLGDVFDRGPNQLEILWLIYSLEAQAAKAGGGVHFVLGNHEVMELRGDERYLNERYALTRRAFGLAHYAELFGTDSVLGQWLRSKPAVLKIGDSLCLHGGISPEVVERKLALPQINGAIRAALSDAPPTEPVAAERGDFLLRTEGPLWYRGYFAGQQGFTPSTDDDVSRALAAFGVARIVVGHTIVPTITALAGGKVIAVQVYPKREAGVTRFENLIIRNGKMYRALPDGSEPPL